MEINTPWLKNKATGIVSVKAPVGDTQTVSGNPVSISNPSGLSVVTGLSLDIEPSQDLNGYEFPWVGGTGKNKLPLTVDGLKAINTRGTWSGNTYTDSSNVTFRVDTDGNGNITQIVADGTASSDATFYLAKELTSATFPNQMIINGCPSGGGSSTYRIRVQMQVSPFTSIGDDTGSGKTVTFVETTCQVIIRIQRGQTVNNLVFKPMLRLATETDATYEPYSNICPITGHTSATVQRSGKNLFEIAQADKWINASGAIIDDTDSAVSQKIPLISGVTLTLSTYGESSALAMCFYKSDGTLLQRTAQANVRKLTATSPDGTAYMYAGRYKNAGGEDVQLELGTEDTAYEPYQGQTVTVDLNGTRYGGTLDVLTGVLTVDRAMRTVNGSENWAIENADESHKKYWITDSTIAKPNNRNYKASANIICDKLPTAVNSFDYITDYMAITGWTGSSSANYLYIMVNTDNTDIADATALKEWLTENPITVVYKLVTPQTVQLTAQQVSLLTGTNIISTDMNSLTVTTLNPDWQSLIDPSSMKVSRYDLDAGETTGRNLEGYMLRDRQAVKEKIEMEFPPMYASDFHTMMELTKEQSFYVWYYSPYYGQWRAADMYVGDREGNLYYGYDSGHAPEQMWTDIKFNFIER